MSQVASNELPIILEELPNFRLRKIENESKEAPKDSLTMISKNFLLELQDLLDKQTDQDSLYALYDYKFNFISERCFEGKQWKTPESIEEEFEEEGLEFDLTVHYLYSELCYRHLFARGMQMGQYYFQELKYSWDNYIEIFNVLQVNKKNFKLPCAWIWDIIDEFIYQFELASKSRLKVGFDNPQLKEVIDSQDKDSIKFWNTEKVIALLQENIEASKIIQQVDGKQKLIINKSNEALSYLGYFSLIGLMRVEMYNCNYEKALQIVEIIDYESLFEYSKAVASYLTLFYYTGFSYLMTKKYKEAVKTFESILVFFNKYKTFMTQAFQYKNM